MDMSTVDSWCAGIFVFRLLDHRSPWSSFSAPTVIFLSPREIITLFFSIKLVPTRTSKPASLLMTRKEAFLVTPPMVILVMTLQTMEMGSPEADRRATFPGPVFLTPGACLMVLKKFLDIRLTADPVSKRALTDSDATKTWA